MTCGGRDVLFERALGGLPVPLLTALRGSGLDDAATLLHYPVDLEDEGERGVPSGATSTAHPSILSSATSSAGLQDRAGETGSSSSDRVVGACVVEMGGDPRTVHSLSLLVQLVVLMWLVRCKKRAATQRPTSMFPRAARLKPTISFPRAAR